MSIKNNKKEDVKPEILKICKYGDPILKQKTKPIKEITPEIIKLVNDMLATMYSVKGIGLAANQVGKNLSLVVIDISLKDKPEPIVLLNPKILSKKGKIEDEEGCLSFPKINIRIKRAKKVQVEAFNLKFEKVRFEAEDLIARVMQHEIDHINGKYYINYLPIWKRWKIFFLIRQKRKRGEW